MEFITDRTRSDVLLGNEKGSYGYADLNRVETAVAELSAAFGLSLTTKTNWAVGGLVFVSDMERYLSNVAAIRAHCATMGDISSFPDLPTSMVHLTHDGANNIEKVLALAWDMAPQTSSGSTLGTFVIGKSTLGGI